MFTRANVLMKYWLSAARAYRYSETFEDISVY